MKSTSKTIIFFGTEEFSTTVLKKLLDEGYNVRAVVTKPDTKRGRGHQLTMPSVKTLALAHSIEVWQPLKVSEINEQVATLSDPVGILVSYGKIIPQSTIDLFTPGIINVHPSLLPKYRGPSPIESAIAHGDTETGVSIMLLSAAMDAGPVYIKQKYPLTGHETRPELYDTLAALGADLLIKTLPTILGNNLAPTPQDDSRATYCQLLKKEDAHLNLSELSAIEAERLVRAHLSFPKSKAIINNHHIIITKAHVTHQQKTPLDLLCRDGAYLSIDELVAPSGRRMDAAAFLRGYAVA
ncbi:MAG TPA: methionyl-tRNA formyltransferase [Candidatus Saccharimonadales bacterium]